MPTSLNTADTPAAPAPADSDSLASFEAGCIDLLCRQENALSQLGENKKRRPLESPDLARTMLMQFLDFSESHFEAAELETVGQCMQAVHQQTRAFETMLDMRSFVTIRKLLGATVPSQQEMDRAHMDLRHKYRELYKAFFAKCETRFREDSEELELFRRSVATFLSELDRKW